MPASALAYACDYAPSVRRYDLDGRMHCASAVLTKACVSRYFGAEIPHASALGLRADELYPLLRDPAELAKALPSFNALPVLMRHVAVNVTDHRPEDTVGATGTDAAFDGISLTNSLVLWTAEAISAVESGRQRDLSVGYRFSVAMEPGTYKGERYVGRMVELSANHLALVSDGRVPGALIGDAAPVRRRRSALESAIALVPGLAKTSIGTIGYIV